MVSLNRDALREKVLAGDRISGGEALELSHWPLEELGALANARRDLAKSRSYGGRGCEIVTYIVDRNINYTNVCNVYCKFCAFYRVEKDDDSYVITFDEIDKKLEETVAVGGTQILMQGGHHPKLTKQWYLDLLSHLKEKFPEVNVHGFSPSEFVHFREVFNEPLGRIYLDNFPNVQSSWMTQGQEIGQVALKYGANDLGSIMLEENVVSQAGTTFRMNVADMKRLIADLAYDPRQRNNWYQLLN